MEPEFWHSNIKITQIPNMKIINENNESWLCNPLNNSSVYGVKFSIDDKSFSWTFFTKAETKKEAIAKGHCLLAYLIELYPGLDGEVSAKAIDATELNKKKVFHELILPSPRIVGRIFLLRKIVNLFNINRAHQIEVYVLWQRDDSEMKQIKGTTLENDVKLDDNYKIKIFLEARSKLDNRSNKEETLSILKGHVEYLTTGIQNEHGEGASLRIAPQDTWKKILEGRPFWRNLMNLETGRYYRGIEKKIPEDEIPGFVSPNVLDFRMLENLPINKAEFVRNENVDFNLSSRKDNSAILIGYKETDGRKTFEEMYFQIKDFVHHFIISGLSGSGKTSFLSHIDHEFKMKAPKVGVLNINLLKKDEEFLYNPDTIYKYGDPSFKVPYFFSGENIELIIEQVASYLIASLGLKNVVEANMHTVINAYVKKKGKPPRSLKVLFLNLLKWFKSHPYHVKYQMNIVRAIRNRILRLLSSPILDQILALSSDVPRWFEEWREGKHVFIDLTNCSMSAKRLLTNAIFQLIRTLMPEIKTGELKNVIILDEASQIGEKPTNMNTDDDMFVTKYHLESVFTDFLRAFRSRGISLIIADPQPSKLFESLYSLPSVKILFRTDQASIRLFSNNSEEQDSFMLQKNRRCVVLDGVNGQKFAIYTKDVFYSNFSSSSVNKSKEFSSHHDTLAKTNNDFSKFPSYLDRSKITGKPVRHDLKVKEND